MTTQSSQKSPLLDSEKEKSIILDSIADGVFTVDTQWRISSFNLAAEKITGVPRSEAIGQLCRDVLKATICEKDCCLRKTMKSGEMIVNKTIRIIDSRGRQLPVSISTALLKDEEGNILGAVETFRDISIEEKLRKTIDGKYAFEDIISKNHRMQQLFDILPDVAVSSSTVLIEGESGTGKELIARAIHNLSPRKNKPFVAVNCGALPDSLLESELFGYKAGAFTDARKDKPGRFSLADRGTIFLDEIGDISPAMQVRLLRVLQEKRFEPLGSVESRKSDARVLAATNRNIMDLVREGTFREDLYYRINVVQLHLPPLRERMEDIPLLVEHFILHNNAIQKKEIKGVTDETLCCLMSYDYPGNIRELANVIERAFVMCKSELIQPHHLPAPLCASYSIQGSQPAMDMFSFKEMEAVFLTNALRRNGWSRIRTARELGIHKSTLFRKIKDLGVHIPDRNKA